MLITFLVVLSVILLSMLMTLNCKCDQVYELWQQLEFTSEFQSDLQKGGGLLISVLEKLTLFRLTGLIIVVLLM